ncbi:hypothetical protein [Elizabethkingia anophelis]|uniref:hypothetical protein n=1 Tax=Elizabethkingia anophelis TaxID=1117645 RepID=UPI003209B0D8
MKKHILIHGNHDYLKTTFICKLLKGKTYERINSKDPTTLKGSFSLCMEAEGKDILYYQNVDTLVDPCDFMPIIGACYEHKTDNNIKFSMPSLIVEYSGRISIPKEQTFLRRFHIINVDTMSYFEVINFLNNGLRTTAED